MTDLPTRVYLDHAATTPMLPEAIAAMTAHLGRVGNPSSLHASGRDARRLDHSARRRPLHACDRTQVARRWTSICDRPARTRCRRCGRFPPPRRDRRLGRPVPRRRSHLKSRSSSCSAVATKKNWHNGTHIIASNLRLPENDLAERKATP